MLPPAAGGDDDAASVGTEAAYDETGDDVRDACAALRLADYADVADAHDAPTACFRPGGRAVDAYERAYVGGRKDGPRTLPAPLRETTGVARSL